MTYLTSSGAEAPQAFDALIVGAGPAGLGAASILGRCRRRVLVCDRGGQRNRWTRWQNGFLSRDGIPPDHLRATPRMGFKRSGE